MQIVFVNRLFGIPIPALQINNLMHSALLLRLFVVVLVLFRGISECLEYCKRSTVYNFILNYLLFRCLCVIFVRLIVIIYLTKIQKKMILC